MAPSPTDYTRRSFVYRSLVAAGARFEARGGAAVAMGYARTTEEAAAAARGLALADLCPLPRIGFKGRGAPQWLNARGVALPPMPNRAQRQPGGALAVRLSHDEHLILGGVGARADACEQLMHAWSPESAPRCYPTPRADTHLWYVATGTHTPAMLAKLCAVDMRTHVFADGCVAQTSLARINAILIRSDFGPASAFHILADSAFADYLWPTLLDAMEEFGGEPVGLSALLALNERRVEPPSP